jgi:hypothetical protein
MDGFLPAKYKNCGFLVPASYITANDASRPSGNTAKV